MRWVYLSEHLFSWSGDDRLFTPKKAEVNPLTHLTLYWSPLLSLPFFLLGLLITVPLSFALPSFTLSSSRRKRDAAGSFGSYNDACANMTSDDFLPSGSYDDAAYSEELKKLTSYFNVLEVNLLVFFLNRMVNQSGVFESVNNTMDLFRE